ncbi:MAG: cobyrinate a,c-diamide synthase [Nitrososphaeria archaeon]|nr:cobyrinate a,c-diamide synthase [Nitrosopumilaceae archaeon]NIP09495.1 cobyrinate a,c-diamide synthase [Nitrosopumilaceae archaeon]NIP91350.1 cobyrinate a,c-diamide synthase [Nitrososphaeria archaeon]NIS94360.1 cobyrinate a,c-diamide synthase [Nitrosopumilaceae archaeon]
MKIPRLVLAGTTSGVGKTSITCAIIYGLKKRGYSVQPFKVGPDYIDPSYLTTVSKKDTYNLDVWLMGKDQLLESFVTNSNSDISIIEGVMGYYDGYGGNSNFASTHHVSSITKSPVILVLDASKTARSIAATALGFVKFHSNSRIKGVILNNIASKKHEFLCRQALENTKLPILGIIPKNTEFDLQSRHLGLIPTIENISAEQKIKQVAKTISDYLDIEKIIKILHDPIPLKNPEKKYSKKIKTTIGIALDNSFNFYYRGNLEALRQEGANLKFFSPIKDSKLPKCDGLYIGGGFPEVLGKNLEKNQVMRKKIKEFSENNQPIYAECGGLMYLTKSIDYGKKKYRMSGVFDAETIMTKKMKLNYTKGKIISTNVLANKKHQFQGHEFHYSKLDNVSSDLKFAYELKIGDGIKNHLDGLLQDNTLASYGHLYFKSSDYSKIFVENCIHSSRS